MYVCVCACMCRCVRVCMCVQHNANVIAEFEKRAGMAKASKEQGRSSGLGYFELNPLGAFCNFFAFKCSIVCIQFIKHFKQCEQLF